MAWSQKCYVQSLKIPRRFRENVDLASLMVKSKPYHDNEELLTMCYRCSSTNPLMNNRFVIMFSNLSIILSQG